VSMKVVGFSADDWTRKEINEFFDARPHYNKGQTMQKFIFDGIKKAKKEEENNENQRN